MKTMTTFTVSVLLAIAASFAQDYHPFPTENAAWNTMGDNDFTSDIWNFRYAVWGDTMINGVTYSKIYSMADSTLLNPESEYFAAIREDENKKVYCLFPGFQESLLYDFGAATGDTVWHTLGGGLCYDEVNFWEETHYQVVTAIDSVVISNGEYRKRLTLNGTLWPQTWIEGIGSVDWYGLFNPLITAFALCGDDYQFVCFKQDNVPLWLNNPYCNSCFCDLNTGTADRLQTIDQELFISPNPATSALRIRQPQSPFTRIALFTSQGVRVLESEVTEGGEILVSGIPEGFYFLKAWKKDSTEPFTGKLIIR